MAAFDLRSELGNLVMRLKRREVHGAFHTAVATLTLVKNIVLRHPFASVQEVITTLRSVGSTLSAARPIGAWGPPR